MTLFVYADESGVFDVEHNEYFAFGGVIVKTKEARDREVRKYRSVERSLGSSARRTAKGELKATTLSNKDKYKLYRSLGGTIRFAIIVEQKKVHERIFLDKKSKQRFLDYIFKVGLKRAFEVCIKDGFVSHDYDGSLVVRMDEHTTATNGRYELREALEEEFKRGAFNQTWNKYHPPLFENLKDVTLDLRDSCKDPLIRAADIVANRAYYHARKGSMPVLNETMIYHFLP
jgi:hypothetical protein